MTRTRRSLWTFLANQIGTVLTLLISLASTPLLLRWLGPERLGVFQTLTAYLLILGLLELGMFGGLQCFWPRAWPRRPSTTSAVIREGLRTYAWLVGLMVLGGVILCLVVPFLIPVAPELMGELRWATALGALSFVLVLFNPFRALTEAGQRGYLIHGLLLLQTVLVIGLSLLLARNGWGLPGQMLALLLGSVPMPLLLFADACRRHPGLLREKVDIEERRTAHDRLRHLNRPTLIHNLCGRISITTDNPIVAALLGPAAVFPFATTRKLVDLLGAQVTGLGAASWAALAELHFQGEHRRFNERLAELTRLMAVLGAALLVPAAVLTRPFVALWVGEQYYAGDWVTALAAVNAWLLAILSLWGWVFNATGQVGRVVPSMIVGAAVNFPISLGYTWWEGSVAGPLLGSFVNFTVVSLPWLALLLHRHFGTSFRVLGTDLLKVLVLAAPYGLLLHWLSTTYPINGWDDTASWLSHALGGPLNVWLRGLRLTELGLRMGAASLCFLALCWFVVLTAGERSMWWSRLRMLVPGVCAA